MICDIIKTTKLRSLFMKNKYNDYHNKIIMDFANDKSIIDYADGPANIYIKSSTSRGSTKSSDLNRYKLKKET